MEKTITVKPKWEEIEIIKPVNEWLDDPKLNYGLVIIALDENNNQIAETNIDEVENVSFK